MADLAVTERVTKPGAYIGRINRVAPSGITGFRRAPCYVGRGSRFRTVFNQPIRRSYLSDVDLAFPSSAPHVVALAYPAQNNQQVARLFRSDGVIIPASRWQFLDTDSDGSYESILLTPEAYDPNFTFALDYQSTSTLIRDELPFDDVRAMRYVGDTENQELYEEFTHYYLPISITAPDPALANASSGSTDVGFEPAQVTGSASAPFVFAGGEILDLDIDGTNYSVTFTASTGTGHSAAEVAAEINAVLGDDGLAVDEGGQIGIRSASVDPGLSAVVINAGTANAILGLTGAQWPPATSGQATGGYTRQTSGASDSALIITSSASSNHDYNRRYEITITGVGATISAEVQVYLDSGASIPEVVGGGTLTAAAAFGATAVGSQPQLPFHSTYGTATTISFDNPSLVSSEVSFTDITGDTITMVLDDSGATPVVGSEVFETSSVGPSMVEISSAVQNTQQHASFSAVSKGAVSETAAFPTFSTVIAAASGTSSGSLSIRADAEYTGVYNRRYALVCTSAAGTAGSRTASFVWQSWGEHADLQYDGTSRTINISEALSTETNVDLGDGILVDFDFGTAGSANFEVDDIFWFQANAERSLIRAKDDRAYQLDVSAIGTDGADNVVTFSYVTGTSEGSFGFVTATGPEGDLAFSGNIQLFVRNLGSQTTAANRFAINDQWTFDTIADDVIDWSLTTITSETIDTTQIYTDALGVITGTVGLAYTVLQEVPDSVIYVKDTVTDELITSYSLPSTEQPYLAFSTAPTNAVEVRYEYAGEEPGASSLYYVTANIVREDAYYDTPQQVFSYEDAARLLGPSATSNDLLIMAQIALEDNDAPSAFFCQAKDSDGDGVITPVDVNSAIEATEDVRSLTDVVVLNSFSSLSTSLANNEKMNDPFERGDRALWVGAPIGTDIGSYDTPGTLIYLARRSLQVFGENPAHGKRVLIGNTEATKTITLTDGTQVTVTLDGSFIAGAVAARNASFTSPSETLLRKNLFGFDSMEVYTEPEELRLVGASILFMSNQGTETAPVFRIEESTTVDTSSDDNNEISVAINQKEYVTRVVRQEMDDSLISIVPPSEQAGVAIVRTFLASLLNRFIGKGIISPYTDGDGSDRMVDPDEDIVVFRDTSSKTTYNFKYWWVGKYPLKRLAGLYSVDEKLFGEQV